MDFTNCYSYAINGQIDPNTGDMLWMNPGYSNKNIIPRNKIRKGEIEAYILTDAENYGFGFIDCNTVDRPPTGAYRVALFTDPGNDYHWYRQNPDGTWSHKMSRFAVTDLDASNKYIQDPLAADRDYRSFLGGTNYTEFVGYYFVFPLSYV